MGRNLGYILQISKVIHKTGSAETLREGMCLALDENTNKKLTSQAVSQSKKIIRIKHKKSFFYKFL